MQLSFLSSSALPRFAKEKRKFRVSPHRPVTRAVLCVSESTKEKQVVKICKAPSLDHRHIFTSQELQEASSQRRFPTGLLRIVVFNTVSNQPDSSSQESEKGILFVTTCDPLSMLAQILRTGLHLVHYV